MRNGKRAGLLLLANTDPVLLLGERHRDAFYLRP